MATNGPSGQDLLAKQHILFAFRCLKFLPTPYQDQDSNRCAPAPIPPHASLQTMTADQLTLDY